MMADGQRSNGSRMSSAHAHLLVSAAAVTIPIAVAILSLLLTVNSLTSAAAKLTARIANLEVPAFKVRGHEAGFATEIPSLQRGLAEVHRQFCAHGTIRNLMHAHELRDLSMVWKQTMGGLLPIENTYYPHLRSWVPTVDSDPRLRRIFTGPQHYDDGPDVE